MLFCVFPSCWHCWSLIVFLCRREKTSSFHYFSMSDGVFLLPRLEVSWCVLWGAFLSQGNIHFRSCRLMQVSGPSASSLLLTQQCPRSECTWSNRKDEQNKHMLYFSRDAKEDCVGRNLVSALGDFSLAEVFSYSPDDHIWVPKSSSVSDHMKACLLSKSILTAQITASVRLFYEHGKCEEGCEEILVVAHTLSCLV